MRLLDRLFFAAGMHRLRLVRRSRRAVTRKEQHRAEYGPSQSEVAVAVLVWLAVLLALICLSVRVLLVLHVPSF